MAYYGSYGSNGRQNMGNNRESFASQKSYDSQYDGDKKTSQPQDHNNDNFYDTTPIHGFNFIGHSKNRKYVYFWLILMVIFFILMVANFTALIYQYATMKPVTAVQMNVNSTMEMPPVTMCVVKFDKNDLVWNLYDKTKDPYPGTPLYEVLPKALTGLTRDTFLANWDAGNIILQTAYYYFKKMSRWEQSVSDQYVDIKTEKATAYQEDDQWRAAEMLEQFIIDNKISRKELFVKLGQELNKVYQLKVTINRFVNDQFKTEEVTYPSGHPLTWVSESEICFLIQLPYKIGDPNDQLIVHLDVENSGPHRSVKPKNPIRISMNKKTKLRSVDDAQINTYTSYLYSVSSELASVFETRDHCSTTKSQNWCQAECRQKLIKKTCGCQPFDFDIDFQKKYDEKLEGSAETCLALKHLDKCKPYKGTDDRRCMTKDCLPDCQVESQQIIIKGSEMIKKGFFYVNYIQLRLSIGKFIYPSFKLTTVMQFQNFIADFGGLFGLYFGASFLSIVHVGEYLFRKAMRYKKQKNNQNVINVRKFTGLGADEIAHVPTPVSR